MQIFTDSKIDFIKQRKLAITLSSIVMAIGIFSLFFHKGLNYSIDFLGGMEIQAKAHQAVPVEEIRKRLSDAGIPNPQVTTFGSPDEILIRVLDPSKSGKDQEHVVQALNANDPNAFEIRRVENVGPRVGEELKKDAIYSIIWALIGIVIYITVRFEFRYSMGAIIALIHDVLITLTIFSLFDLEVSAQFIAAALTIVGYSLNDTIIIYDRIRENLNSPNRRSTYMETLNISLNETLSRTLITSVTTLVVVLILLFFGGEVIFTFAVALTFGIVVGTYSSLYIATPFLVFWENKFGKDKISAKSGKSRKKLATADAA